MSKTVEPERDSFLSIYGNKYKFYQFDIVSCRSLDFFYLTLKDRISVILWVFHWKYIKCIAFRINDLADRLLRNVNVAHVTTVRWDFFKCKIIEIYYYNPWISNKFQCGLQQGKVLEQIGIRVQLENGVYWNHREERLFRKVDDCETNIWESDQFSASSFDIFPGTFTETYDTEVALLDLVGAFGWVCL